MRYILSPKLQLAILRHFYCKMVFICFGKKNNKKYVSNWLQECYNQRRNKYTFSIQFSDSPSWLHRSITQGTLKILMPQRDPDQSSHNLWGWDQLFVFQKVSPSLIHTKLRSTIGYTSLSGLTEEKTDYELSILQVRSHHQ